MGTSPGNQNSNDPQYDSSFEALMQSARSGDENAVGTLIDRYRNYLLLIANDDVGQKLKAKLGASDAVQESIMHAQLNFNQFQGASETEFKAWLRTILVNDIRKERRKFATKKRDAFREVYLQEQSDVGRGLVDDHLTPSSDAVRQEKEKAMLIAMQHLSDEQRQIIRMRNIEKKRFEEIAQLTGRTAEAARKFWARSIEALKNQLRTVAPDLVDSPSPPDEHE